MVKFALLTTITMAAILVFLTCYITTTTAHNLRQPDIIHTSISYLSNKEQIACNKKAEELANCMYKSGDTLDCAKCMLTGLDYTVPITCDKLNGKYCHDVSECVHTKCKQECIEKFFDGLNCAIQQTCSDITCSKKDGNSIKSTTSTKGTVSNGSVVTSSTVSSMQA